MKAVDIRAWRDAVESDLVENILPFWSRLETGDGYLGGLNNDLTPLKESPIGLIMVARLLWTYARAYRQEGRPSYLDTATRAHRYLIDRFEDREYGGFYWQLDSAGRPIETKKQTYGQAFVIYGFSEYFMATGDAESLGRAVSLFNLLEDKTWNTQDGGYWEAYDRQWGPQEDVRLSAKELNAPFTMNTHLHLMEAYANLLKAKRTPSVEAGCRRVVRVVIDRIVLPSRDRFGLFYSEGWQLLNDVISPGHDIEGSWLLWETSEIIADQTLQNEVRPIVLAMAGHTLRTGVDDDGGLFDEIVDGVTDGVTKSWWPQAEAAIGFLSAYQLAGDTTYLQASRRVWDYIVRMVIDHEHGDWLWGREADGHMMGNEKAGPWKSSYHNSRMGFELMERLDRIEHNLEYSSQDRDA